MSEFADKCRELGKARWDAAAKIQSREDYEKLWPKAPKFPIEFGKCWTHTVEYYVDDFLAEVGFFIDMMGLEANAYQDEYVMLKSPGNEFYFSFWKADENAPATLPKTFRMLFMVKNPVELTKTLKERGVEFIEEPKPVQEGSTWYQGKLQTPNGIAIHIWGDTSME
ncbi:MAG TPA: hypothetical protein PKV16_07585 [Caldisericia bacterium]|nr:hypothetical protein [Caldisericia bacterium]HPF49460.1 hypothetical protein [Caldisericia bacterium]HPI84678.1 hypothetical protein [Caldisericia bacterium]HPQ93629.1 hypothetical protein [Caldisericia bacterium]HRV75600.1 hypothetical protein [Caldisericia bacterium]